MDRPVSQRIPAIIDKLTHVLPPAGVSARAGIAGVFRIRVADADRILYTIDDGDLVVLVDGG
jgi:mRNA-degrading endonuclease RelE of RelBE toxin-antitoxin system